jgi:rhombotail lipoprotein
MTKCEQRFGAGALALLLAALAGCATQTQYNSSAVDYLYPGKSRPVEVPSVPVMSIPMKVGIAFVPESRPQRARTPFQTFMGSLASDGAPRAVLTERQKTELMQKVAGYFRNYPFISGVEIVPSAYLKPGGSFDNLDQIGAMYGVDAIALLGYDQVQFSDQGAGSLLYWTIVGAYVVKGEKNTTETMMDAVVYDIKSRKMLFRAPGVSKVKGSATPVNQSEELRRDSEEGFRTAAVDLILNLDDQLISFRDRVKREPERYKVVQQSGYRGGGSLGWVFAALVALAGGYAWRARRRR